MKSQGTETLCHSIINFRIGSGSASRSIYGGAVEWKGVDPDLFYKEKLSNEERMKLSPQCIATQV